MLQMGAYLFFGKGSSKQLHAAVDVKTDTSRRDDTLFYIQCRSSADRETVAPMSVRHTQCIVFYTGQTGNVGKLFEYPFFHVVENGFCPVYSCRDPHALLEIR